MTRGPTDPHLVATLVIVYREKEEEGEPGVRVQ